MAPGAVGIYAVAIYFTRSVCMNKRNGFMAVLVLLAVNAGVVFAQSDSDWKITQLQDGTIRLEQYLGTITEVVIPSTIQGLQVTQLAPALFDAERIIGQRGLGPTQEMTRITSVVFPDWVTEIPNSVCRYQERLSSVTFGRGVVRIGDGAFSGCSLRNVELPAGLREIGNRAFSYGMYTGGHGNRFPASLTLPGGLRSIGSEAFEACGIKTLVIPPSVQFIGDNAFSESYPESLDYVANDIRRVTLPANMSESNVYNLFHGRNFTNFYMSQGRAAGTYVWGGQVWTRE
jgi:hypothetical protein